MIRDFPRSLAAKLNLAAATLILVTALGITLFVVRQRQDGARQELLGQGRSIATMLGAPRPGGHWTTASRPDGV